MNNKDGTGSYYTIGHLVQFTGLTDRTVRNYIASGVLQGEKINGLWHFTPEQVDRFMGNPAVRPSILAKKHGYVYDFLTWNPASGHRACLILDFPGEDRDTVSAFFCQAMNAPDVHDLEMSFDCLEGKPRVILKGDTRQALALAESWYLGRA